MLDINKISAEAVYNDKWRKARLGKITASPFSRLIGESSHLGKFTSTAITYIEGLVGEIITQEPATEEFFTDATNHGNATEPEAIDYFCEQLGLYPLRDINTGDTHKLIINDKYSGCTPDALLTSISDPNKIFDLTDNFIKVIPLEVKSPMKHHRFIKLFKCNTPADLKRVEPIYYWQVMFQMYSCNTLEAYFGAYNSKFNPKGKLIKFRKVELVEDLKKLSATLEFAKKEIEKTKQLFIN